MEFVGAAPNNLTSRWKFKKLQLISILIEQNIF